MGGSNSKSTFIWDKKKKKKKSPLDNAWRELKGALPNKKRKKKSKLNLNLVNLKKEKKHRHNRFSKLTDKKEASPLKRLSLGNTMKEWTQTSPPGRRKKKKKDGGGGLEDIGEHIKKRLSLSP